MSNTNNNLTAFLDNIGRTIIGKTTKQDDKTITVQNPALVHIQANPQTNQLQLQILPLFFREFQSDKSQSTVWTFQKSNITTCEEISYAPQFVAQYEQLFAVPQPPQQREPEVVKLFDE